MSDRRWKSVPVSDTLLLGIFQTQPEICGRRAGDITHSFEPTPLPVTAIIRRVYYDVCSQSLRIVVEDKSFEPVSEGMVIPTYDVEYLSMQPRSFRCVDPDKHLYELVQ